jgi:hypothetical protein
MTTNHRSISRRDFLASGVGAVAGFYPPAGLRPSPLRAAEPPAKPTSRMQFGLATYT